MPIYIADRTISRFCTTHERTSKHIITTVDVFLSYAHKDEQLCHHFREHLSALRRAKIVNAWYDRKIDAGGNWEGRIDGQLERAHLVLFLVSSSFGRTSGIRRKKTSATTR